jgi:uncharacterized protein YbaR (Trm112 family)/SAM-dependent methyltransferase
MWQQAVDVLACPRCRGRLALRVLEEQRASAGAASAQPGIETGVLSCAACRCLYPIYRGVPILLRYVTPLAQQAARAWPAEVHAAHAAEGFTFSGDPAPRGEKFVGASFSTEWQTYEYGDTLWTAPTAERLSTFRGECGLKDGDLRGKRFCEIGCGLGILTNEAASGLEAEAWGMDLSTAVFRAAQRFKDNTRLHFVQASVFSPPFAPQLFDFVYSHGVLHHTWNTREAVRLAAELVRPDGSLYVWLYGYDDVRISLPRRVAFALEALTRPVIARLPPALATAVLLPTVPVYQFASLLGRRSGTHGATYSPQQALHAARDRFTPLFAHRHEFSEVADWYTDIGLKNIHKVAGAEVSPGWALAIERNVAIRGRR